LNLDLLVKLVMGWHRKLTVFRVVWRTFSSFRNSSAVSRNGSQSIATLVVSGAGLIFSLRLLIEFQSMGGRRRPSRRLRGLVPCVFNRRRSRYSRPHGDREETKEKKKVTRGGSDLSHYVVQLSIIPSENHIRRLSEPFLFCLFFPIPDNPPSCFPATSKLLVKYLGKK
jgi:hypothetical protein